MIWHGFLSPGAWAGGLLPDPVGLGEVPEGGGLTADAGMLMEEPVGLGADEDGLWGELDGTDDVELFVVL